MNAQVSGTTVAPALPIPAPRIDPFRERLTKWQATLLLLIVLGEFVVLGALARSAGWGIGSGATAQPAGVVRFVPAPGVGASPSRLADDAPVTESLSYVNAEALDGAGGASR